MIAPEARNDPDKDAAAGRILIVDDEKDIRHLLAELLSDEGYSASAVADRAAANAYLASETPDLVILDLWLKDDRQGGMTILADLRRNHPDLPVIIISGHGTIETALEAVRGGAYDFIEKPFQGEDFILKVARAIETSKLRHEVRSLRSKITEDMVLSGRSNLIREVRDTLAKIAPTSSRILISGEGGVGKEFFARRIHALSPRAHKPFVVARSAAVTAERFQDQFLASDEKSPGFLARSAGGSLYLDEICDLAPSVQDKLIAVLHELENIDVDDQESIRIISSSRYDLMDKVADGTLRKDLFFFLNVLPLRIPPLRARRDDIKVLIDKSMAAASRTQGLRMRPMDDAAMTVLQQYAWPGNIRQLRNVIDWLLIMFSSGGQKSIGVSMLPPEITGSDVDKRGHGMEMESWMDLPLRAARQKFEKDYLLAQLADCDYNITRVARRIGMERTALHRKIKVLDIPLERSFDSNSDDA